MNLTYTGSIDEQVDNIKRDLETNVLRVTFTKKSTGEERVMDCTTAPHIVENLVKGTGRKVEAPIVPVYDMKAEAWRSFDMNNVTKVEVLGEFVD